MEDDKFFRKMKATNPAFRQGAKEGAEKLVEMLMKEKYNILWLKDAKEVIAMLNKTLAYFKDTLSSSEKIEGKCKECGKFTSTRLCGYCNAKNLSPAPQPDEIDKGMKSALEDLKHGRYTVKSEGKE